MRQIITFILFGLCFSSEAQSLSGCFQWTSEIGIEILCFEDDTFRIFKADIDADGKQIGGILNAGYGLGTFKLSKDTLMMKFDNFQPAYSILEFTENTNSDTITIEIITKGLNGKLLPGIDIVIERLEEGKVTDPNGYALLKFNRTRLKNTDSLTLYGYYKWGRRKIALKQLLSFNSVKIDTWLSRYMYDGGEYQTSKIIRKSNDLLILDFSGFHLSYHRIDSQKFNDILNQHLSKFN